MTNNIPDNFVYFGLFILDKDKEILKNFIADKFGKEFGKRIVELDTKIYLEHCTVFHKNDKHQFPFKIQMYNYLNNIFEEYPGMIYRLRVVGYGYNEYAFALKVELPDGIPYFMYKVYHITVCTFHRAKPVESNNIINWYNLNAPINVYCQLKKVIRDENI